MDSTAGRPHRRARHVHSRRLRRRQRRAQQSRTRPPPTAPAPLSILPPSATVYPGTPATLTISGGTAPYRAFSSNPAVLPVAANVTGNTDRPRRQPTSRPTSPLAITIQDAAGQSRPRSPSPSARRRCSARSRSTPNAARLRQREPLLGPDRHRVGDGHGRRPARRSPAGRSASTSCYGPFAIAVDQPGVAAGADADRRHRRQRRRAGRHRRPTVNAPTQTGADPRHRPHDRPARSPATSSSSDNTSTASDADGRAGDTATITGAVQATRCSAGFIIDYYIYGGTPPYRVSSTFPAAVTLVNRSCTASGGFFQAITNGTCVDPLTFTDRRRHRQADDGAAREPPGHRGPPDRRGAGADLAILVIAPVTVAVTGCSGARTRSTFVITGGTPPYSAASSTPGALPSRRPVIGVAGGTVQRHRPRAAVGLDDRRRRSTRARRRRRSTRDRSHCN